jgi:hypothetical protein
MYTAEIRIPVTFDADTDETARLQLEHITRTLEETSLPHSAEVFDAPGLWLAFNPRNAPQRIILDPEQFSLFDAPNVAHGDPGECATCTELRNDRRSIDEAYA